jgi:hypothetical protein
MQSKERLSQSKRVAGRGDLLHKAKEIAMHKQEEATEAQGSKMGRWLRGCSKAAWGLFLLLLMGCAPRPYEISLRVTPQIDPWIAPRRVATVCVLRPQHQRDWPQTAYFDNGRLVGMTEDNGVYFCYLAKPGAHRLVLQSAGAPTASVAFHAISDRIYYFEQLNYRGHSNLRALPPMLARKLLVHLLYAYAVASRDAPRELYDMPVPARHEPSAW